MYFLEAQEFWGGGHLHFGWIQIHTLFNLSEGGSSTLTKASKEQLFSQESRPCEKLINDRL